MNKQSFKTQTAVLSAVAALNTVRAKRKISGSFSDDIRVTISNGSNMTLITVETPDLRHEVVFDKFGMVMSETLFAFERLFGIIDWNFVEVFKSTYSYQDGYKLISN